MPITVRICRLSPSMPSRRTRLRSPANSKQIYRSSMVLNSAIAAKAAAERLVPMQISDPPHRQSEADIQSKTRHDLISLFRMHRSYMNLSRSERSSLTTRVSSRGCRSRIKPAFGLRERSNLNIRQGDRGPIQDSGSRSRASQADFPWQPVRRLRSNS